ncbi:metalloregulator ArsR/SmtB family transcription factor, partial [Acinetobacter baumannii]
VQVAKALADPTRARIVRCLCVGPVCVCELADALEIGMSTLSTHLQTLRTTGVVTADKRSKWVSYSLNDEVEAAVRGLFESLRGPDDKQIRVR